MIMSTRDNHISYLACLITHPQHVLVMLPRSCVVNTKKRHTQSRGYDHAETTMQKTRPWNISAEAIDTEKRNKFLYSLEDGKRALSVARSAVYCVFDGRLSWRCLRDC